MSNEFRPTASLENNGLRVAFADPKERSSSKNIDVVLDIDDSGAPCGIELLGLCATLGARAADNLRRLPKSQTVRANYDPDSDSLTIGVSVGSGTRIRNSIPKVAMAGISQSGQLVTLELPWSPET